MTDEKEPDSAEAKRAERFNAALLVIFFSALLLIPVILVWAFSVPPPHSGHPGNRHNALMTIEQHGGVVPHDWFEERGDNPNPVYQMFPLNIHLGPEWTGGNEQLAQFPIVGEVHQLFVDNPAIDDRGLAELDDLELGSLFCESTRITDVGLGHLAKVRGLRMLQLDGSQITDAGLEALRNHDLLWLALENDCQVTDAGLAHLAELEQLVFVSLVGTQITKDALDQLDTMSRLQTALLEPVKEKSR